MTKTVRLDLLLTEETITLLQAITESENDGDPDFKWDSWRELAAIQAQLLVTEWAKSMACRRVPSPKA